MAKTKKEEKEVSATAEGLELDLTPTEEEVARAGHVVPASAVAEQQERKAPAAPKGVVNCLRNEKVIVRHVPRQHGIVTDPKHVLYGGMARTATRKFSVPRLASGILVNVLTNEEKACLEQQLGLEPNELSIYRKKDNYWDDSNGNGVSQVTLTKGDNIFDLSNPEDYIRYKILLANKDVIASSMKELQDNPKATYQFVCILEGEELKVAKGKMNTIQQCYKEFGKIEDDADKLRVIIETLAGKPISPDTDIVWLQTKANELIQANDKLFLSTVTDPLLSTKVLIKKAIEQGIIAYRSNQLFLREDNSPLCEYNEEPTLNVAAKYLSNLKHQDLLFAIQAKLKK